MWKKVIVFCFFVYFISLANGNRIEAPGRVYEWKIHELLEDLRQRMCYDDPEGLPQLEPLILNDHYDFGYQNGNTKINAFVRNLRIQGLSTFVVDYLTFLLTLKFNVTLVLPQLHITGDYGVDGNLGGFFKIKGNGPFRLDFRGIQLSAGANFIYNGGLSLQNLKLDPKLDSLQADLKNLTANEMLTMIINGIISNAVPSIINEHIPPETMESIVRYIEDSATNLVKDITVSDLLGIISGGASVLPPIDPERTCKVEQDETGKIILLK
ncbi:unnamed protein product [Hermetia illucens]|uniref:Hemolymph juvenile hormone binding protein n=1 Tax=Hermetia illucens TaxID=343691 RepID=A0A7R8Z0I7_HERIL|nr:uncharacterized protein LOC119659427 [Hermetia illucens]CAD7092449.1 unnamed protein product [Hermetia illucens]